MKLLYLLFFLSLFTLSCNGQGKTAKEHSNSTKEQPKIVRTQNAGAFGNIICEVQDKDGNIWFSSSGEGAFKYDGKSFINLTVKDGLNSNEVNSIIQDKNGHIIIGTDKGICKYDGKSITPYSVPGDLSNSNISGLLADSKGNLWIGTFSDGIYRYDGENLSHYLSSNKHPFNLGRDYQLILNMYEDSKGNIWFGSWNRGGAWKYDGTTFTNYVPSPDYYKTDGKDQVTGLSKSYVSYEQGSSIADDMMFSVSEDSEGNIWFATRDHGACRYDGKTFTTFQKKEGFINHGVYSILEDRKGNIWLTTDANGVFRYDGKTFTNFTTKDGLINNSVFSILEDKDGNLWFGTRGFGLCRYDGKTFTNFSDKQE